MSVEPVLLSMHHLMFPLTCLSGDCLSVFPTSVFLSRIQKLSNLDNAFRIVCHHESLMPAPVQICYEGEGKS